MLFSQSQLPHLHPGLCVSSSNARFCQSVSLCLFIHNFINVVCFCQRSVMCCMESVWVCCWTTSIQTHSTSSTASPWCLRPPRPCCTSRRPCSATPGPKSGRTTWMPGTASLTRVTPHCSWNSCWKTLPLISHPSMLFSKADRCIQNIYRQLRKNPDAGEKYPGVLASLLMLDKLSIEDIKASITELMAGGVDTVREIIHARGKVQSQIMSSFTHSQVIPNLYDFHSSAKNKRYFEECW